MNKQRKLDEVIARAIRLYLRENKKQLYEQKPGELIFVDPEDDPKNQTKNGGEKKKTPTPVTPKKDSWGRPSSDKAFGFNEKEKKFTEGPNKGKRWNDVYPDEITPVKKPVVPVVKTKVYDFSFSPSGKYGKSKRLNGYQMRAKELYDCKSMHIGGVEFFARDHEDLYALLICGSEGKVVGNQIKAKYRDIESQEEWDAVEKELKVYTGNRGIVIYADSFVSRSDRDFWESVFDKIGALLGGDRLKEEMKNLEWNAGVTWNDKGEVDDDDYGYGKIWTKWKNFGPNKTKKSKPTEVDRLDAANRKADAMKANADSGISPGMTYLIYNLAAFAVTAGIGTWLLKRVGVGKSIGRFINKRALANIEESELLNLHEYVEDRYKMYRGDQWAEARVREQWEARNPGKTFQRTDHMIREREYQEWLAFYQNRNKLFWARRAKLADALGEVESGRMSMRAFIEEFEEGGRKMSEKIKRGLLDYEKNVLRQPERAPVKTPKPKPKTPPKPKSTAYKQSNIGFGTGKPKSKGKKP